jgi:hypothetical protein
MLKSPILLIFPTVPRQYLAKLALANPRGAETEDTVGHPAVLWWRAAILDPGGRTIELDTPSGWTADWQAYADRYHGPACAVTPIAGLPKPRAPVNLDEALAAACEGVAGVTPARFRALLSPEDIADIEAGGIHPKTLHAYAESFAEGIVSGRLVPAARAKP